ncbi:MAG: tetratricopeptide repeat protein [Aureibaculum sp.]
MKKVLIISFLIIANFLSAQGPDSLFVKANKLYQSEKYDEALNLYNKIDQAGLQSDLLYYNIANAYYKLNKVASAIYYYEKALLLNPNNDDARFNLGFAKRMAIDNIEPLPKTFSQKINENIILKLTYNTWAWVAVGLSFLFAILFFLYHFSYNSLYKRIYFITGNISAFLAMIIIAFAYQNYNYFSTHIDAIIFAQQTDVKSAPTKSSEVNFELHEGTKVEILESLDNWKKIKIADGRIGWLIADDLKVLQ